MHSMMPQNLFEKLDSKPWVLRPGMAPLLKTNGIILNANPLEDIANLKNIAGVMVRGKWLDKKFPDRVEQN